MLQPKSQGHKTTLACWWTHTYSTYTCCLINYLRWRQLATKTWSTRIVFMYCCRHIYIPHWNFEHKWNASSYNHCKHGGWYGDLIFSSVFSDGFGGLYTIASYSGHVAIVVGWADNSRWLVHVYYVYFVLYYMLSWVHCYHDPSCLATPKSEVTATWL